MSRFGIQRADEFSVPSFFTMADLFANEQFEKLHLENHHWTDPAMNVIKSKNEDGTVKYDIYLLVPGYSKDSISVEILDNTTLVISGKHESEESNKHYELREFSINSSFVRKLILPNIQENNIHVELNNGVLKISLLSGKRINRKLIEIE